MSHTEQDLRTLRVEWVVARVVFAIGIVASIAAFVWLGLHRPPSTLTQSGESAQVATGQGPAQQFCSSAVGVAQSYGIVPNSATPSGVPQKTDVTGRYVCLAQNGAARFTISVDLLCRDLGDQRCFSLFTVTQDDGSVLFQRQS
jgi:hypothetical protein